MCVWIIRRFWSWNDIAWFGNKEADERRRRKPQRGACTGATWDAHEREIEFATGTSSSYTRRILSCVHFSSSRAAVVAGCASKNARRGARDAPRATTRLRRTTAAVLTRKLLIAFFRLFSLPSPDSRSPRIRAPRLFFQENISCARSNAPYNFAKWIVPRVPVLWEIYYYSVFWSWKDCFERLVPSWNCKFIIITEIFHIFSYPTIVVVGSRRRGERRCYVF